MCSYSITSLYLNSTTNINKLSKQDTHRYITRNGRKLFFTIEQPNITIIPALQKLDNKTPDIFMAILWNPGSESTSIKREPTFSYMKESDHV